MRPLLATAWVLMLGGPALGEALPLPPIPPPHPPYAQPAPVPNVDVTAPVAPPSEDPKVDVTLFRSRTFDSSAGFAPGSRYQSTEDRKAIQTPGFTVTVPFK